MVLTARQHSAHVTALVAARPCLRTQVLPKESSAHEGPSGTMRVPELPRARYQMRSPRTESGSSLLRNAGGASPSPSVSQYLRTPLVIQYT